MHADHSRLASGHARLALLLGFVLLGLAVYHPVLQSDAGFVWDDDAELWGTRGALVQADDGPLRAWWPIVRPEAGWHRVDLWRPVVGTGAWPLTPTVLWLEWRLFGADDRWAAAPDRAAAIAAVTDIAWRFHVPNVLLHALAAWLLVLVLRRLEVSAAPLVGLVFLVHPVCVPSVAWVSELKNGLFLTLALVALHLHLLRDERAQAGRPAALLRAGALVAFALSLLAKSAAVGLPVVLLALAFLRRRRIGWRDLAATAPYFVLALASGLLTLWFTAQSGGLVDLGPAPGGLADRLAQALLVPWSYLGRTFWPLGLTVIYPSFDTGWARPAPWLSAAAIAVIVGLAWRTRAGAGAPILVAAVAYAALLFPVLGLFRMTYAMHAPVADHLGYAALPVPLALVVGGAAHVLAAWPARVRRGALAVALAVVAALALLSHGRAERWKDHATLWAHNVALNPDAWMARYNLGSLLAVEADTLAAAPGRGGSRGPAPQQAGRARAAARRLRETAVAHLERAAGLEPRYFLAHYRLATVQEKLGRSDAAIAALEQAARVARETAGPASPEAASMQVELARAHARQGDWARARDAWAAARDAAPASPVAWLGLAGALEQLGEDAAAARAYERVLSAQAGHAGALAGLAWLRASSTDARVRRPGAALRLAARAERTAGAPARVRVRARAASAGARAELAREAGGLPAPERAVALARQSLRLARRTGDARAVALAIARLRRFGVEVPGWDPGTPVD